MRLKIIRIFGLVILLSFLVIYFLKNEKNSNVEPIVLEIEFLQESRYDIDAVKEYRYIHEDASFLFLEDVRHEGSIKSLAEEGKFAYPNDIDFENYIVLIAYGRKILTLEAISTENSQKVYGETLCYCVTFEEEYFEDTVFIYQAPRDATPYCMPTRLAIYTYVMEGAERVQVYVGDINRAKKAEGET